MTNLEWIKLELGGLYGGEAVRELDELNRLYRLYDGEGQESFSDGESDATRLVTNLIKKLIKEESRFMAGRAPELRVLAAAEDADAAAQIERFLAKTLSDNRWQKKLLHGVRDCFIGKRVALCLDGAPGRGLMVRFVPATEFVYELDECGNISKIIFFYGLNDLMERSRQRVYRKKLWMDGGRCLIDEGIFDGYGRLVEAKHRGEDTGLTFVPAYVIVNDGLTGDLSGESDARELAGNQLAYNRLKSDDIDALKFNMFPQKVLVDASQASVEHVVIAPGALHRQDGAWDEIILPVECYLPYEQGVAVAALETLAAWLQGMDFLTLSNRPGRRFRARLTDPVTLTPLVEGFADRIFALNFWADPFAYEASPTVLTMTAPFS